MKLVEWMEHMVRLLMQKLCRHHYRKHYDKGTGGYVNRCTRCGKKVERCHS